jgi:Flagellar biosynthesis/type III secretory pathway protein
MKFFSLIYQGDVHTDKDAKTLSAEDYSTLLEAQQILEKAKDDAARYQKETEKEGAALKEKAKKEGFDAGLLAFNEHILFFEQELKRIRHEMNKQMLPLVLKAAKKIVGKELETHPEAIVDIVLQALQPVVQSRRITIYVSKTDKERLETEKAKLKTILEQVESFHIRERADIEPGGCIIETETGIINASLENQWRALETAFEKYMKPK